MVTKHAPMANNGGVVFFDELLNQLFGKKVTKKYNENDIKLETIAKSLFLNQTEK